MRPGFFPSARPPAHEVRSANRRDGRGSLPTHLNANMKADPPHAAPGRSRARSRSRRSSSFCAARLSSRLMRQKCRSARSRRYPGHRVLGRLAPARKFRPLELWLDCGDHRLRYFVLHRNRRRGRGRTFRPGWLAVATSMSCTVMRNAFHDPCALCPRPQNRRPTPRDFLYPDGPALVGRRSCAR